MYITYEVETGKVVAYSDNPQNRNDIKKGQKEIEVDMEFQHVATVEGGLSYDEETGEFSNQNEVIAKITEAAQLKLDAEKVAAAQAEEQTEEKPEPKKKSKKKK